MRFSFFNSSCTVHFYETRRCACILGCDMLLLPCLVSGVAYVCCDNPSRSVDCELGFGSLLEVALQAKCTAAVLLDAQEG